VESELRAELRGEFLDPWFQLVVLVGKRKFGTFTGERLRDPPGDRSITREPDDQRALSGHETH
jgi:hypothetical protein